ncbi:iron complex transport system substrate-binding protein [Nocardioides scoriae]|uniref:Iron complex transport system substrate-binding protein n=1 Tax=Nocardioides scoriae TaxID=642780 RepID=A0A1H1STT5_9ACTN|nr:ABC transporter substrate-binding protein [Nocardioides scoriae]SDS51447.1 iron complex transport system substrate-binding protein [Nocardioides scoriae]
MRVVSLLPSTTEILFAIGAGDDVVGVTFECDHPVEARERRIVSTSALPEGLSPREIDAFVRAARHAGEDLYRLDAGALEGLDADLVVTQDLCAVCAVDVSVVQDALSHLGTRAEVLTIDPHTLAEVLGSVLTLGRATGREAPAEALVQRLEERLQRVRDEVAERRRAGARTPRMLVLEWTDPAFTPGHWVPEMVELAGATCTLGQAGATSVRADWSQVRASAPDVVVCAPCGYDLPAALELARELVGSGELPPDVPVWAVDANASFARPGPRLVDGVETLAAIVAGADPHGNAACRVR